MLTDQSREQLQVLLANIQVQTTIVQIHLRAATQGGRSEFINVTRHPETTQYAAVHDKGSHPITTKGRNHKQGIFFRLLSGEIKNINEVYQNFSKHNH